MTKKHTRGPAAPPPAAAPGRMEAFTFGDPTPVMDRADILGYAECLSNGEWYDPPVNWGGLAKTFRAGTHHSSAMYFKRNVLASTFIPHKLLSRQAFSRWALDYLTFGNGYVEKQKNRLGGMLKLEPTLGKYTRRGLDRDRYFQTDGYRKTHEFAPGSVFHLMEPDINQEVYGLSLIHI